MDDAYVDLLLLFIKPLGRTMSDDVALTYRLDTTMRTMTRERKFLMSCHMTDVHVPTRVLATTNALVSSSIVGQTLHKHHTLYVRH